MDRLMQISCRITLFLFALGPSSCTYQIDECAELAEKIGKRYSGVVLALPNGETTFALSKDCGVIVEANDEFLRKSASAWEAAIDTGILRPIEVDLIGDFAMPSQANAPLTFQLQKSLRISSEVSIDEANEQFLKRTGKNMPRVN